MGLGKPSPVVVFEFSHLSSYRLERVLCGLDASVLMGDGALGNMANGVGEMGSQKAWSVGPRDLISS